ncbi:MULTISPECIES: YitT family protein [Maribacter]|uniref:YitT family protein n=1 Tax=Maribacter flavus TaxID=1658664 RepID=A0ABU7IFC6_9FLAO|nr:MULTISPECIES: YitT family protein [Maribacter]MDC6404521.1 YitT family protein [Maribacter sp. PR66]MEE1971664.1 YitT family protein [Maribacter flavus]
MAISNVHIGPNLKQFVKDAFFLLSGILAAAFGLESFLLPNQFIDGGATGISLLLAEVYEIPLYVLIILVNIPFIFLGYKVIGRQFTIKTTIAIVGLAFVLVTLDFPEVTQDKLLVAVFGGFFLGAGIGLSVRGGGVLDGTEILAIYLSRKMGTTIGDIIILINVLVFMAAAYLLSVESALYSMLTYLAASKTLDFVIEGIEEYTGVTIISDYSEQLRDMIINVLGRGVTIYPAKGGYGKNGAHNEYDVLFTVITRLEIRKLNIEISKIDPKAFVVMSKINDTRGGMIKKRNIK